MKYLRWTILVAAVFVAWNSSAWAQAVSGVRGINGGVGALHNLAGPEGSLYMDGQGTQGYINNVGTFQSYNFRIPYGPTWSGSMMTLGPQLSVGLISGANQAAFNPRTGTSQLLSSPTVLPSVPRELPPLPEIESSLLDIP
jgi:hypothetical protein